MRGGATGDTTTPGACMCTETHAHTRGCTHTHAHASTHAQSHTHTRARTHARVHARTHARVHARTHTRAHARTRTRTQAHTHAHTRTHARARAHACDCCSLRFCSLVTRRSSASKWPPYSSCTCTHTHTHAPHARTHAHLSHLVFRFARLLWLCVCCAQCGRAARRQPRAPFGSCGCSRQCSGCLPQYLLGSCRTAVRYEYNSSDTITLVMAAAMRLQRVVRLSNPRRRAFVCDALQTSA
jgi:hypothetical protein